MLTEENEKDIRFMYDEGYSPAEIKEEYPGIDPVIIDNICDEEFGLWTKD